MRGLELKVPPVLVVLFAALGMWVFAQYLPLVLITFAGQLVVALIFAIIGMQIAVAGVRQCHEAKTTVNPLKPESSAHLVTVGVYKVSRNPMYLGFLLALIGWGVWLGSLTAFIWVLFFAWYMTRFQIQPEERALAQQFGDQYLAYTKNVRRWL